MQASSYFFVLCLCMSSLILSDVAYEIRRESIEAFNFSTSFNYLIFLIVISNLKFSKYL